MIISYRKPQNNKGSRCQKVEVMGTMIQLLTYEYIKSNAIKILI